MQIFFLNCCKIVHTAERCNRKRFISIKYVHSAPRATTVNIIQRNYRSVRVRWYFLHWITYAPWRVIGFAATELEMDSFPFMCCLSTTFADTAPVAAPGVALTSHSTLCTISPPPSWPASLCICETTESFPNYSTAMWQLARTAKVVHCAVCYWAS